MRKALWLFLFLLAGVPAAFQSVLAAPGSPLGLLFVSPDDRSVGALAVCVIGGTEATDAEAGFALSGGDGGRWIAVAMVLPVLVALRALRGSARLPALLSTFAYSSLLIQAGVLLCLCGMALDLFTAPTTAHESHFGHLTVFAGMVLTLLGILRSRTTPALLVSTTAALPREKEVTPY